jgi:hypothetical protein
MSGRLQGWSGKHESGDSGRGIWYKDKRRISSEAEADENASYTIQNGNHPHKANSLTLGWSKANVMLGCSPSWQLEQSIDKVIEWAKAYRENRDLTAVCLQQLEEYTRCDHFYEHP